MKAELNVGQTGFSGVLAEFSAISCSIARLRREALAIEARALKGILPLKVVNPASIMVMVSNPKVKH